MLSTFARSPTRSVRENAQRRATFQSVLITDRDHKAFRDAFVATNFEIDDACAPSKPFV